MTIPNGTRPVIGPTAPFQMGDVVSLKSGIILMTVENCNPRKDGWLVYTIWFDHNRTVQRDAFDAVSLQQWKAVDHG